MQVNQPNGVKLKRGHKLSSSVNWVRSIKEKGIQQGLGLYYKML